MGYEDLGRLVILSWTVPLAAIVEASIGFAYFSNEFEVAFSNEKEGRHSIPSSFPICIQWAGLPAQRL